MKNTKILSLLLGLLLGFTSIASAQQDSSAVTMNYNISKISGINTGTANVNMYPNPATNVVFLYLNTIQAGHTGQCIVYNAAGVPCAMQNITNGTNAVSLAQLPAGMYTVRILLKEGETVTKKLIVAAGK